VTDLQGNQTESVYDDHGSVIRQIQAVTENGQVTKYLVTVTSYTYGKDYGLSDAMSFGATNLNKLISQTVWQPFTILGPDATGQRYILQPTDGAVGTNQIAGVIANSIVNKVWDSAADSTASNPGLWLPETQSVAAADGTQLTTHFYDYKAGHARRVVDA